MPCQNGGRCTDSTTEASLAAGTYACTCSFHWYGLNCETTEDDCTIDNDPCQFMAPGSTCVDCARFLPSPSGFGQGPPNPDCAQGFTCEAAAVAPESAADEATSAVSAVEDSAAVMVEAAETPGSEETSTVTSQVEPAAAPPPAETAIVAAEPPATRTEPTDTLVPTPAERALLASAATPSSQAATAPEAETATAASAPQAQPPAAPETVTAAVVPAAPVIPIAPSGSEASSPSVPSPGTERVNEPQVFGVGNWNARVVLTARADVWVQVSTADGRALLSRILRQGDKYLVPSQGEVLLTTGNAGALAITVDGKSVPPIGPAGAVRREVLLSPDRLLATAASGN